MIWGRGWFLGFFGPDCIWRSLLSKFWDLSQQMLISVHWPFCYIHCMNTCFHQLSGQHAQIGLGNLGNSVVFENGESIKWVSNVHWKYLTNTHSFHTTPNFESKIRIFCILACDFGAWSHTSEPDLDGWNTTWWDGQGILACTLGHLLTYRNDIGAWSFS